MRSLLSDREFFFEDNIYYFSQFDNIGEGGILSNGMKVRIFITGFLFLTIGLFGCAHKAMRGTVAMKISDQEAHVCLGDSEVKRGDRVNLFVRVCPKIKGETASCKKSLKGTGTVTEVLNDHYSVVKLDSSATFEEGAFVEVLQ